MTTTTPALDRVSERLVAVGSRNVGGSEWTCPAHEDNAASLTVKVGDKPGCIVMKCGAGCPTPQVLTVLGLTEGDLFDKPTVTRLGTTHFVYTDEDEEPLFRVSVTRMSDGKKSVRQSAWRQGRWEGALKDVRRPLYKLPAVDRAIWTGATIHVLEGESDVEAFVDAGEVATCAPGGAGKWRAEHTDELVGAAHVVLWGDRDLPGYRDLLDRLNSVMNAGISVEARLPIPDQPHADGRDHLTAGHTAADGKVVTADDLAALVAEAEAERGRASRTPDPAVAALSADGIRVDGVEPADLMRQAVNALAEVNDPPTVFQRDGELVERGPLGVTVLSEKRLRWRLTDATGWFKARQNRDGTVGRTPVDPPPNVVSNVMVGAEEWPFPRLDRIVTTPVFAADGSLRSEPGYHAPSRSIYVPPDGLVIPPVNPNPTKKEVRRARQLIDSLFQDFAFVGEADRTHAVVLTLQPFARELIRGETPLFSAEAPTAGTGKGLLVQSALAAAVGEVKSFAEPHGDEEMEKRLNTAFKEGFPVIFFDNLLGVVNYQSLASALTKRHWTGRTLGSTATVSAPITCTFVIAANNPRFTKEMQRRVVRIRQDTGKENPSDRDGFALSLPSWAHEHRGELIWAACTLISSWLSAGRPAPPADTPALGSYGPWRRVMGGIVGHLGYTGFLANQQTLLNDTPDQETFESVLTAALALAGDEPGRWFTANELAATLYNGEYDTPDITGRSADEFRTKVPPYLRAHNGGIVNGYRLERSDTRGAHGYSWRFVAVAK